MNRKRDSQAAFGSGALGLVVGAALIALVIGVVLGSAFGPGRDTGPAREVVAAVDNRALEVAFHELANEVRELRGEFAASNELVRPEPIMGTAGLQPAAASVTERVPIAGTDQLDAIFDRLSALETLQRQMAARGAPGGGPSLTGARTSVPAGVSTQEFLGALEELGSDEATRIFRMWSTAEVRSAYGPPDEIKDQGSYIEWIYRLAEEGEQFDFHFVNGLCVQAH